MAVFQFILVLLLACYGRVYCAGVCEENRLCADGCAPAANTGSPHADFVVAIEEAAKKNDKCKSERCVPNETGEDICKAKCDTGKGCSVAYGCEADKIPEKWTLEQGHAACETGNCVVKEKKFICEAPAKPEESNEKRQAPPMPAKPEESKPDRADSFAAVMTIALIGFGATLLY